MSQAKLLQPAINTSITLIKSYLTRSAINKWLVAKELHMLYSKIPWEMTKYKSFGKFCKTEFKMSQPTASKYVTNYKAYLSHKYTPKQLETLCDYFAYTHLAEIFKHMKKKLSVVSLISAYENTTVVDVLQAIQAGNYGVIPTGLNFQLHLDVKHAAKLDEILKAYGMVITSNNNKQGISKAMAAYLDLI